MSKKIYAPQVNYYIECYGERGQNRKSYTEETHKIIDKIFEELKKISPTTENGCRELWFSVNKGRIEDFKEYEYYSEEEVSAEELKKLWKEYYPKDVVWHHFEAVENNGYRVIVMDNRIIYQTEPETKNGHYDIVEFAGWMYDSVLDCIKQLKNGTYLENVEKNLPDDMRTGIILRKDIWEIDPEDKAEFFEGLSEDDVSEFISYIEKQKKEKYLSVMTANDFYHYCAIGYKAMGYEIGEMSPKEQYYRFADGRDEGLGELDGDSQKAFEDWMLDKTHFGGHPWEVCRGGNSTHISLFVHKDENGYALALEGSSYDRTTETIKFYLALRRNKIPVYLWDGLNILERVLGNEKVGVVPKFVTPAYCHSYFPNDDIISFMNLPYDVDIEPYAKKCIWQKIREIKLL